MDRSYFADLLSSRRRGIRRARVRGGTCARCGKQDLAKAVEVTDGNGRRLRYGLDCAARMDSTDIPNLEAVSSSDAALDESTEMYGSPIYTIPQDVLDRISRIEKFLYRKEFYLIGMPEERSLGSSPDIDDAIHQAGTHLFFGFDSSMLIGIGPMDDKTFVATVVLDHIVFQIIASHGKEKYIITQTRGITAGSVYKPMSDLQSALGKNWIVSLENHPVLQVKAVDR